MDILQTLMHIYGYDRHELAEGFVRNYKYGCVYIFFLVHIKYALNNDRILSLKQKKQPTFQSFIRHNLYFGVTLLCDKVGLFVAKQIGLSYLRQLLVESERVCASYLRH